MEQERIKLESIKKNKKNSLSTSRVSVNGD
jgi:hypothetical protein